MATTTTTMAEALNAALTPPTVVVTPSSPVIAGANLRRPTGPTNYNDLIMKAIKERQDGGSGIKIANEKLRALAVYKSDQTKAKFLLAMWAAGYTMPYNGQDSDSYKANLAQRNKVFDNSKPSKSDKALHDWLMPIMASAQFTNDDLVSWDVIIRAFDQEFQTLMLESLRWVVPTGANAMRKTFWHRLRIDESFKNMEMRYVAAIKVKNLLEANFPEDQLKAAFQSIQPTRKLVELVRTKMGIWPSKDAMAKVNHEKMVYDITGTDLADMATAVAGLFVPEVHYIIFAVGFRLGSRAYQPGAADRAPTDADNAKIKALIWIIFDAFGKYVKDIPVPSRTDSIQLDNDGAKTPLRQYLFACCKVARCIARVAKRAVQGAEALQETRGPKRAAFII